MTAITWFSAVSGDWSTIADWNPAQFPVAGDDVFISVNTAAYTLTIKSAEAAGSIDISASNAKLEVENTLALGGLLTLGAGTLQLDSGSVIDGGTISATGGTLSGLSGTLEAVTYEGTLDLSATSARVTVLGGITLTGAGGAGPGTVSLIGQNASLIVDNTTTLDNATINIGNASANASLMDSDVANAGSQVLTLGSQLALTQTGANVQLVSGTVAGDGIVNMGSIGAGIKSGQFTVNGHGFTNEGSIAVSNGDNFTVQTTSFSNTGSMSIAGGSTVTLSTGWTNTGSISVTASTLNLQGTFAASAVGAIGFSAGTLHISGLDINTGATLDVSSGGALGTVTLINNGTIRGGVINAVGGTVSETNGTLDGVTYEGVLDLSATSARVSVLNGITLTGAGGTGAGTVSLIGLNATLAVDNTTTLDNATINIGNASGNATLVDSDLSGTGAILTLGSQLTVTHTGASAQLLSGALTGDGIVNLGSIGAGLKSGQLAISGKSFTNQNTIAVSNGDNFTINTTNFSNTGSMSVAGGSTLTLNDTGFTNTGSISVTASTMNLQGTVTTTAFGAIGFSAGSLTVKGLDINTGATLDVSGTGALGTVTLINNGTIRGGVINAVGGTVSETNGTLDGVTYEGVLDLSATSARVSVLNGITLTGAGGTGPGTVSLIGLNASLVVDNTTTLDDATIDIGNASGNAMLTDSDVASTGGQVLTLGGQLTVTQTGVNVLLQSGSLTGDGIVNLGSIGAATKSGQLAISGKSFTNQNSIAVSNGDNLTIGTTNFSNTGSMSVAGGSTLTLNDTSWTNTGSISVTASTLNLQGTVTTTAFGAIGFSAGTLNIKGLDINTGATLDVSGGGALGTVTLINNGTIRGGVINAVGGTVTAASGTLDGVTYEGTLDLSATSARVSVLNGITLTGAGGTGPGTVSLIGQNSSLVVDNTTTLDNATINIGNASSNGNLIDSDVSSTGGQVLTLGSQLAVTQTGANAALQSGTLTGDGIVNLGSISAGIKSGRFTAGGSSFSNQGSISISNGDEFVIQPTTFTNLSGTTLTGGSYDVEAGSTLQLQNNLIFTTDNANITLGGTGSVIESLNTATTKQVSLDSVLTAIGSSGTLNLQSGRVFTTVSTFTNGGLLELGGTSFSSGAFSNLSTATVFGHGTFNAALTNTGLVEANGGLLTLASTVGGTGGFKIDAASELEFSSSPASGQVTTFNGLGATLKLDVPSSFAGTIDSFSPGDTIDLAGITTATGAVIADNTLVVSLSGGGTLAYAVTAPYSGDHLKVTGDGGTGTDVIAYGLAVPGAHTPEPVNLGDAHVASVANQTLSLSNTAPTNGFYENLDASVGGATTGVAASGSFSLVTPGATDSTDLVVGLDTSADGDKVGTATITLTSDGTGVDGLGTTGIGTQTVNITGAVFNFATASAATPNPMSFGDHHVGDVLTRALTVSNTGTADGFTENLDASIGNATGSANATGAFTALGASLSNSTSLVAGLNSAHDGVQSGTATIALTSDGAGVDTLGTTALTSQTIAVSGTLFNFATASAATPNPIAFGQHHVADVLAQALTITNIGTVDGFTENLDAGIGNVTGSATASGSFSTLGAGFSNSTSLIIGLNSAHDGVQSGTAALALTSDGAGVDTLGTTALSGQTIAVSGTLFNFATASAATPNPIAFGQHHVGDVLTHTLTVSNTGTADGFTENLDASIGSATGSANATGSFTALGASLSNSTSLIAGLNTAHDGVQSGTATIALTSDGAGVDTLGTTALTSQTIAVSGTLFNVATASAASPNPVSFGEHHVGDVLTHALTVSNTGTDDGFTENLDASIGNVTGSATATGSFTALGASLSNSTGLVAGLNSAHDGVQSGTATIALTSDGAGVDTLGTTALTSQTIAVSGTLFNFATASAASPNPVSFGERHVGDVLSQALSLGNIGTVDGFTENLDASIGNATGSATAAGSFAALGAGVSNSTSLVVGLSSAHDGAQSGTATIALTSDGTGVDTLGTTALTAQTIAVGGTLFNFATASAATPNPIAFGQHHVGDVLSHTLTVSNTGTADGFTENLDASIGDATGSATATGSFTALGASLSNSGSLAAGLNSAHDGVQSGTATIALTSDGAGVDTLGTTALTSQTIAVSGTLFNFATASAASPNPVSFGEHHVGDVLTRALTVSNTGTADGFTETLDASIGSATGSANATGSFTALGASLSNSSSLIAGLDSAHDGVQSGTATIALTSDGAGVDTLGTTAVNSQTIAISGTLFNFATASAATPNPIAFGQHHVGDVLSHTLTVSNIGTVDGFTENLDASIGATTGSATATGSFAGLAASLINSTSLVAGLNSAHDGVQSGTATIALTSDGAGVDTLGTTALTSQTIAVSGTLFNFATASATTPNPVSFGEHHVGDVLTRALTVSNTGTADGFTENLDASIGAATGSATAAGSFATLGAGISNSTSLIAGLNTAHDGVQSGTATIALTSDGAGVDTLGTTALTSQTIAVSGTLFNFATASSASPNPVSFGEHHVGDVLSHTLTVSNIGTVDGFTENLDASIGGATGSANATGSFSALGAGVANSTSLTVGLNSADDGVQSGTATIALTSDGAGVDTLGTTALTNQTIAVSGTLFNLATASAATPNPVNFNIVHVGDVVGENLSLTNLAAADGFSENLDASIGGATTGVVANGSFTGLAANTADSTDLSVGVDTSTAGTINGTATITLRSDGAGIDTLGTTLLTAQTITVGATVNNFAVATIQEVSGGGVFQQTGTTYTLNLGTITQGASVSQIELDVLNDVSGPSDLLSGDFSESASPAFGLTGFDPFSGLTAGQVSALETIAVSTVNTGVFTEMVTLTPDGSNASSFNQLLQNETLTINANVVPCFLAGTMIATDRGEVLVETLKAGDTVVTISGAKRKLVWVGTGRTLATRGRRNAATPVTILKGALADNVPHHDLRVTKGHSLYLDGVLIPVECLINHRSIIWDDRAQEVTVFHLELETHDVLVANGAAAESYRDDGNRWLFENANSGWSMPPQPPCAPVLTGGELVDAIWRRLLDRDGPGPNRALTDDPDLHLIVDGCAIECASRNDDTYSFHLVSGTEAVRIVSLAAAQDEIGLARDPRSLGVALRHIVLIQGSRSRVIDADDARLTQGFHAFEPDSGFRWTDGDAALPPELFLGFTGSVQLLLVVGCVARYRDFQPMRLAA